MGSLCFLVERSTWWIGLTFRGRRFPVTLMTRQIGLRPYASWRRRLDSQARPMES